LADKPPSGGERADKAQSGAVLTSGGRRAERALEN